MNASELVQQVIEHPQLPRQHLALVEKLPPDEAMALVPKLVQAFHDYKLWPKDAAGIIAACRPTDAQLLVILSCDDERTQKLGMHVVANLIGNNDFAQRNHAKLAHKVVCLSQSESFRPKRKGMRELLKWAKKIIAESEPADRIGS